MRQCVYILHFKTPYRHARHYTGWATDLPARIERHFSGHGSHLVKAVLNAGIEIVVGRIFWNRDRRFERWLKDRSHLPKMCSICYPDAVNKHVTGPSTNWRSRADRRDRPLSANDDVEIDNGMDSRPCALDIYRRRV